MGFVIYDFFLDFILLFIPLYFLYFYTKTKSLKHIFFLQGLKSINWKAYIRNVVIIFFILFIISYAISYISVLFKVQDLSLVGEKISSLPIFYLLYLFVVRVFLEEWFFRGFLVNKVGVIISSILFACGHILYGSVTEVIGAFVLGVVLARYYQKTNNLWVTFSAHLLYNFVAFIIMLMY
jgi:hypothetical protein